MDGSDRIIIKSDSNYTIDLAIDYEDNKLIWLDNTSDKIMRSNLDGSSIETVLDSLNIHSGLVYNHENNKIYWAEYLTNNTIIYSVDKNGMNKQALISGLLGSVVGLVIDYETDKLYWAADEKRKIQRSNYDGSMLEDIHVFTGQERPFRIYIDKRKNKMYWTDYGLNINKVFRSDLNGSNKEEVTNQFSGNPLSIFVYYNIINSTKENFVNNSLSISPNPANDIIYLKFNQLNISVLPSIINIHSLDGKLIQSLHQNHLAIPIHHLQRGAYILKVQFSDGSVINGKFIKS